jgi:hypothetical protein
MYPTLTPVGKSSNWYAEKQTIQDKVLEISYLEERLEAKRLNDIQVGIPILIRGQPILPSKITAIGEKGEDEEEETADGEEEAPDEDEIEGRSTPHHQIESDDFYNMYDQQIQDDHDEDMQPQTFNYEIYNSE